MPSSMLLHATDELRLIALGLEVGRAPDAARACALAADRLEAMLGAPCAVRAQNGAAWHTVAHAGAAIDDERGTVRIALEHPSCVRELIIARAPAIASRDDDTAAERACLDDPAWCEALGAVLTSALQLVDLRAERLAAARRAAALESFSHALLGTGDSASLHRAIVEHLARAVDAEIGAFAGLLPQEGSLAVTATVGYPSVLVEHVRLAPGEGVLGRVYSSGEPLLVRDAAREGRTRRRYRTDSYVALPLIGPEGVVAVVALTDKRGGGAFTEADLATLQVMGLPAALAVSRELLRDRTNDLAHLATVDALTGLFNRRYFETRLEQELQRQRRQFDELSLLMLDLDNFKELNDTQGHLMGDLALKEVAEILRRAVRIFDVCARYGGEEFVILMPGAACATALRIAERIRRQVEGHFASGLRSGVPVPLTVSIGVSTATPSVTRDGLVAQADDALLRAKATGKNQVHLHEEPR